MVPFYLKYGINESLLRFGTSSAHLHKKLYIRWGQWGFAAPLFLFSFEFVQLLQMFAIVFLIVCNRTCRTPIEFQRDTRGSAYQISTLLKDCSSTPLIVISRVDRLSGPLARGDQEPSHDPSFLADSGVEGGGVCLTSSCDRDLRKQCGGFPALP